MKEKPTYKELEQRIIALEKKRTKANRIEEKSDETAYIRQLLKSSPFGTYLIDLSGKIVTANKKGAEHLGKSVEETIGTTLREYFPKDVADHKRLMGIKVVKSGRPVSFKDHVGNTWYSNTIFPVRDHQGNITHLAIYGIDISDFKLKENALRESEARFRELADLLPQVVFEADAKGTLIYANRHAFNIFGYSEEDFEKGLNMLQMLSPDDRERAARNIQSILTKNPSVFNRQYRAMRKDGTAFPVEIYSSPIERQGDIVGLRGILVDMTEHKKDQKEKKKLQIQLTQAQKMESVGRLAGGVAHDFNNMLGVILGYTEMALEQAEADQQLEMALQEIKKAAQRSINVTQQLLAFARKQTIAPKVLDLNKTVEKMLKMMKRLIGEDIDLVWLPASGLWHVCMDPSQLDQILANLCINARDAIAGVGKITIETGKVSFDDNYCEGHLGFVPGDFTLLAVSDDGCGMDKQSLENLFEPFFTTKDVDKGTGLGLATVYGIVKQNNGFINVYSEPNEGTTFKLYLPRHRIPGEQVIEKSDVAPDARGSETVLLVEDEPAILKMTRTMLQRLGYSVLAAATPRQAIDFAQKHADPIHLLITDVVMPEMNGRELAQTLLSIHPKLKRLFMSGYTANVIAHRGVLDEGVNYIQKPFSKKDLSIKVREALGRETI